MRTALHKLRRIVVRIIKFIITIVPKNDHLILFSAWFGKKYADNSMYMYEYMQRYEEYEAVWYTRNRDIYKKLKEENKKAVYAKSLKGIWLQTRAKMLVSSVQLADFNPYFLKNCICLDLGHGFPIKQSGFEQPDASERLVAFDLLLRQGIQYYMASSSKFVKEITCRCFKLDGDHVVKCNMARTDSLFDPDLQNGYNLEVKKLKTKYDKIISYLPTHRSCGKIPIDIDKIFDLNAIQEICEKNNALFLIKKHFYHRNEITDLRKYPNIIDITGHDIETQTLLAQSDVLISDYSACYIDYLLLDRPIILYAYDYDYFVQNERNLYFKYEDNTCGSKAFNKDQFIKALTDLTYDWTDKKHQEGRKEVCRRYFDDSVAVGYAREEVKNIIGELIAGTYKPDWKE